MNLIEIKNLTVKYDSGTALENISLSIKKGEYVGLIGPNGAGKTTLIRVILGLEKSYSGLIERPNLNEIGYIPQTFIPKNLHLPVSVKEILSTQLNLWNTWFFKDQEKEMIKVLKQVNLKKDILNKRFSILSGGQKQRVLIARALINKPKLLIFDEPTTGVDYSTQLSFYQLLAELKEQMEMTILFVSHEIHSVTKNCDRVLCLNKTLHRDCHPLDFAQNPSCYIETGSLAEKQIHHHHSNSL